MFCFFSILAPPSLPRPWFQVTWQHSDKIRLHLLAIKNVEFLFLQIFRNIHVSKPLIIDPSCLTTTYTKTIVFPFFGSKVPFPRVWEVTGKWLAMSFTISVCLLSGQRVDLEVRLRKQSEAESQVQQFASNRHRERMIEFLDATICYIYIYTQVPSPSDLAFIPFWFNRSSAFTRSTPRSRSRKWCAKRQRCLDGPWWHWLSKALPKCRIWLHDTHFLFGYVWGSYSFDMLARKPFSCNDLELFGCDSINGAGRRLLKREMVEEWPHISDKS